jgi:predicted restriction endonuclease
LAFNPEIKAKIVRDRKTSEHLPCVMCGTRYPLPDAVHIIDEKEWTARVGSSRQSNGIPLCPNCHRVFDEVFRPYLYRALAEFGAKELPECWAKNNKISVTDKHLDVGEPAEE